MHLQNFRPTIILRTASYEYFPTKIRIQDSTILIVGYQVFELKYTLN